MIEATRRLELLNMASPRLRWALVAAVASVSSMGCHADQKVDNVERQAAEKAAPTVEDKVPPPAETPAPMAPTPAKKPEPPRRSAEGARALTPRPAGADQRLTARRTQANVANAALLADRKKAVIEKRAVEVVPKTAARAESVREIIVERHDEVVQAIVSAGVKLKVANRLALDPLMVELIGKYNNDSEPFSEGAHDYRLSESVFVPQKFLRDIALGVSPLIQESRVRVSAASLDSAGYRPGAAESYSLDDVNAWIVGQ